MEGTSNHGGRQNVEHDWISSLPDEVLTHILSFLSTKEAVHTCVLSKRWRKTWSIMPVLDFDINGFLMDVVDDDPGEEGRNFVASFERFVHGVLDNRESTKLDIVLYSCKIQRREAFFYMEWLDRVATLMPRIIHININGFYIYVFDVPDLVFSCASLHYLVMEFCIRKRPIIEPMSIYLPCLKDLELTGVELPNNFAQKLFMGCPSLERLDLCFCDLYFSSISSMKLKKLNIAASDQFEEMQISCPDLVYLFITSGDEGSFLGISLKDMTSLVNATIKLHGLHYDDDDDDDDDDDNDDVPVPNLFGGLSNVTNLELHLNIPKLKVYYYKDILNCRIFNNLKKLRIGISNMSCDIYLIACFLKHSPNLKDLTLKLLAVILLSLIS
ncbi:putative F-box protein At1g58310 isoform X2 [Carex rostrata]